ncbi:MAG: thiamine diphosphokinase, partial [Roseburia sp.]|nr:thiamine diphosphokinase [Roseburia sp.]
MKSFVVISGGKIDDDFVLSVLRQQESAVMIAADSGMEFLYRNEIMPNVIVGDFDSVQSEALAYFKRQPGIHFQELVPEKDDTDTESAIRLAISMGAEEITLLGGTGSRLDHVLGNIELLGIGMNAGVPITMLDAHNRIRMTRQGMKIRRDEQFGKY